MAPERRIKRGYHPLSPDVHTLLANDKFFFEKYRGNARDGSWDGVFIYRVFPNKKIVVYSGLNSDGMSTINGTARILESLMAREKNIDPEKFRFFDVQTVRGYDYMEKGKFDITEVKFHKDGMETFVPNVDPSELPEAFRLILPILANP